MHAQTMVNVPGGFRRDVPGPLGPAAPTVRTHVVAGDTTKVLGGVGLPPGRFTRLGNRNSCILRLYTILVYFNSPPSISACILS